jgi:uncharacterized damage-inducible protein DinB
MSHVMTTGTDTTTSGAPDGATPSTRHRALGDLEHELAVTRRTLERVPDEHLAWQPHPKSTPLGRLAAHIAQIPFWLGQIVTQPELDLAAGAGAVPSHGRDAILQRFDETAAAAVAALQAASGESLGEPWTLRYGDRVLMALPRVATIRTLVISHMVHHRAQLGVYLRLLDVPVPGAYGPSADEH